MKLRYKLTTYLLFWVIGLMAQTPQTITFPEIPVKGYGDATFTLNATASSGLAVRYVSSDVTVATVSGSTVTIKKTGAFTVISAYQDGNASYAAATPVPQLLVVCPKATLTVTAADKTIDSGTATPAFTYNITGYKNSETVSVVSGAPAFKPLESLLSSGTYPIVINKGTLTATNYDFQLVDGKLTVNPGTATPVVNDKDTLVNIYPNPCSDYIIIENADNEIVEVVELTGKSLLKTKCIDNTFQFNISTLPTGTYFLKVNKKNYTIIQKLLVK